MKIKLIRSLFAVLFMIFILSHGAFSAEVDLTIGKTVKSSGETSVDPEDNVDRAGLLDNFNRPDGPIGSAWTNQAGVFNVVSNAAQGGSSALATYGGVASDTLEADVEAVSTNLQYTGMVLGYADIDNNYFIKVQNNGGVVQFTHAAFYYGNNGSGNFFGLDENFTTAHMAVSVSGTIVTLTFSNIDGGTKTDQVYSYDYGTSTGGNAIGICGYENIARLDNFSSTSGPPIQWTYCLQDPAYTPQYQISLDTNNSVRGQAVLAGDPSFPAPIVGEYVAGQLVLSISYLGSSGVRYYRVEVPNQLQGNTWAIYNDTAEFYDAPHAAQLVFCGTQTDSNVTASGAME